MAIGDTVQAGLGRMDFSAFQRAGEAQARANQAFGDAIGGVVEKYYQKKQEKQEREEREQAYRKMGLSAEEAKAASGDKDLANQFMNKMTADRNYQLRLDELAIRQQAFDRQQAMLDEDKQATDRFITKVYSQAPTGKLNEAGQDELERGSLFLPPGPEAQEKFRDELLQDPNLQQTEPVMGMTGNPFLQQFAGESPAVKNLALAYNQAEQKRLADLAPDPTDLIKLREEARKTTEFEDSESIKSFTPNFNYLQLGTTKMPITGRLGNEAEAIKYKDEYIPNFNATNETFEELLALGQKRADGWYMESQEKDQAMSYVRQLQGLIREDILGPGTVQESERVILDNIVKNPTAWSVNGAEENMKILKNLRQKIFNRLENRLTNFGLNLGDSKSLNSPKARTEYTEETSTGNKIRIFDFDNFNQEI